MSVRRSAYVLAALLFAGPAAADPVRDTIIETYALPTAKPSKARVRYSDTFCLIGVWTSRSGDSYEAILLARTLHKATVRFRLESTRSGSEMSMEINRRVDRDEQSSRYQASIVFHGASLRSIEGSIERKGVSTPCKAFVKAGPSA